MTTLREVAEAIMEQLKGGWVCESDPVAQDLKAALAEPVQEPVAWMYPDDYAGILKHQSRAEVFQKAWCNPAVCVPLYTAPPQRKPLTEEEIALIVADCSASAHRHDDFSFARAIERAHGIGTEARATLSSPRGSLGEEA